MDNNRVCPACGRNIPLDASLCPYCGKSFKMDVTSEIKTTHTGYGTASLVVGIVGICLVWLALTPFYFFINLPMALIAIILGAVAYWRKESKDNFGLAGFILGLIHLIIGTIFVLISISTYL